MSRLDEDRKKIDVIDRQIAELFEKRFEIVKDVIEYKIENRLPILNSGREAEITRKNTALIQDEDIREYLSANQLWIREAAAVLADYYKAPGDQYAVRCQLKEKEHPRIDLTITVPNKEIAQAICDNWKQQSAHVYEYLMDLLVK